MQCGQEVGSFFLLIEKDSATDKENKEDQTDQGQSTL